MSVLILFDDGLPTLAPLCDLRASFEIRTGALTTLERISRQMSRPITSLITPPGLAPLVAERTGLPVNDAPAPGEALFINGRCSDVWALTLPPKINTAVVDARGCVIAALLDGPRAAQFIKSPGSVPTGVETIASTVSMIEHPWQVIQHAHRNLPGDLVILTKLLRIFKKSTLVAVLGKHPVLVGKGVKIHPAVVLDATAGAIAIDDGAIIHPMSVITGPVYIGSHSTIASHANIRPGTVIGPVCKVGGEVGSSIFQGFANKAHEGYLGDSFIGEWVNLGAGTTTSNLKNTYGPVRMQTDPRGQPIDTGMAFLGSILGDHVKTAIGTRLTTGSCLHTGSMIALSTFAPKCTDRFAFLTDDSRGRYEFEKFCAVAEAMMKRRHMTLTDAHRQRIKELHVG
jgi:UDP-N-acetylglucosamine diphosphorylase/glucosamine-1-phosphate N-acetyltransferase